MKKGRASKRAPLHHLHEMKTVADWGRDRLLLVNKPRGEEGTRQ